MESGDSHIGALAASTDDIVASGSGDMHVDVSGSAVTAAKGSMPAAGPLSAAMDVRYVSSLCLSNTSLITLPFASFTMPFPVDLHILTSIHFPLIKSFLNSGPGVLGELFAMVSEEEGSTQSRAARGSAHTKSEVIAGEKRSMDMDGLSSAATSTESEGAQISVGKVTPPPAMSAQKMRNRLKDAAAQVTAATGYVAFWKAKLDVAIDGKEPEASLEILRGHIVEREKDLLACQVRLAGAQALVDALPAPPVSSSTKDAKKRKGEEGPLGSAPQLGSPQPGESEATSPTTKKKKQRVHRKKQAQASPASEAEGEADGSIGGSVDDSAEAPAEDRSAALYAGGSPIALEELEMVDAYSSDLKSLARAILQTRNKAKAAASPTGGETAPPASAVELEQDRKAGPPLVAGPEEAALSSAEEAALMDIDNFVDE